ncbi:MAG: alpha-amylase family glycosyl hydrolase, partial [Acidimicrobiia bacterium]|nr:alpha-amylase family glycosyl hydrolase [Acidimicrobiia bacterium]
MAESVTTGAEALDGADRVSAPPWWFGTVGYEIYIRSFADSNGDGIGDLTGIAERLEHVAWLGADSIWITPFYPSPGFDHGYDVSDYTDIAAMHGSIADFEKLVARARELDLRVIVDLVPNHTSSQHPWFIDAISSPDSPHRDFYHWADPAADGGPPNNWVSHFGGPAWSLDEASGQYYCHLFLAEQPDLNWENEAVADAFDDILRFWLDRGADGFRIDVAHGLAKHPDYPDNPRIRPITDDMGPTAVFESYEHRYDLHLAATVEIYERWHDVVAPYGAALIGEVNNWVPEQMARYTVDGALDTAFFLRPGWTGWDPVELVATHREMHEAVPDRMSWVLNNHDQARSVSRYGGGSMGLDRSLALSTLEFALGGVPFLYQGEELGLENAEVAPGDLEDPIWTRNQSTETGRDASRS